MSLNPGTPLLVFMTSGRSMNISSTQFHHTSAMEKNTHLRVWLGRSEHIIYVEFIAQA